MATVAHNLRRAVEIGAEGVVVHTGSYVDPTGSQAQHDAAMRRVREGLLPVLDALGDDDCPVAAARADRRAGAVAVRGRRRPRGLPGGPGPPPAGGHLPRHLPRLRRRRAARRARRGDRDGRPDRRDRRARPAAADPRQRLDGRARRLQGPAPAHRRGPHRHRRVPRAVRPPGDRGRARSSWRRRARATWATPTARCCGGCGRRRRRERAAYLPPRLPGPARDDGHVGIDVLPHQGPARAGADPGLPGGAVRDRERRDAAGRAARGRPALARPSAGTRWCSACCTASRRSSRPPGSRTRRPASAASSPACTSC